jgi:PAS domain-containing protein
MNSPEGKGTSEKISGDVNAGDVSKIIPSGILYLDRDGKIIYVNSTAEEILGAELEELA